LRNLRTEQEIMANWKGDISNPLVSISCITYNHEKYIEDALEGFLIQETNFPFEILIHDDASTDKTADIIRQYEAKYSKLIKPIYQIKNQYSQGKHPDLEFNYPRVQGEYIALCEGDDYWTSPDKLQAQIHVMENNNQCDISFHPAMVKYYDRSKRNSVIKNYGRAQKRFTIREVIEGGGGFMPTASIIFRANIRNEIIHIIKKTNAPFGDYFVQVIASLKGGATYVPECMCVYRYCLVGSWSYRLRDTNYFLQVFHNTLGVYDVLNNYLEYKFTKSFDKMKINIKKVVLKRYDVSYDFKREIIDDIYPFLSAKEKVMWRFLYRHSGLHYRICKIRDEIRAVKKKCKL
jgi:glycosyltransferase involved in cell wall biosynthesis